MTRTTVYRGKHYDDDNEVVYDAFHNHESHGPAVVIQTAKQEFHVPEDEWVDIYIDGEPVDE
jgi:hypothetical protein